MNRTLDEPGQDLDRKVAARLSLSEADAFSTDETSVDRLVSALEKHGFVSSVEQQDGSWWATIWTSGSKRERLATGSGPSRPLALCRAVVNLSGRPPSKH